jgi:hypothetical protein
MILHKSILILEDDFRTLSKILEKLAVLEDDQPYDFSLIILTTFEQVEMYINKSQKTKVDIILLDRDCKLGGSFHVLDIERLGPEKVIGISSVPNYNEEARKRGVRRVVPKDFKKLDEFADTVVGEIQKMLIDMKPQDADMHRIF